MFDSWAESCRSQRRLGPRLAGLAVLAVVLPDCGGSTVTMPATTTTTFAPAPTPPPSPTTLADLSASVTSPQADASINCTDDVRARVTLVNRGGTAVNVQGVLDSTGLPSGRCFGGGDFTFRPRVQVALPNTTTVVLDQSLYSNGPGCCAGTGCGSSCVFQEAFEVVTDVGSVPAGMFSFKVFFQNCPSCASARATGGERACARMPGTVTGEPARSRGGTSAVPRPRQR